MWGEIIGGAAGLIGNLIGQRSANKRQKQQNLLDMAAMAQNEQLFRWQLEEQKQQANIDRALQREFAQEAAGWQMRDLFKAADESGIHRLAALGAAGGQSYAPVGGQINAEPPDVHPLSAVGGMGGAAGRGIAELGAAVGRAFTQRDARKRQEKIDKRNDRLTDAQIRAAEAEATLMEARAVTLAKDAADAVRDAPARSDYAGGGRRSSAPPGSLIPKVKPTNTGYKVGGIDIVPAPGWSDAEEIEDAQGDLVSWVYGIPKTAADLLHTVRINSPKDTNEAKQRFRKARERRQQREKEKEKRVREKREEWARKRGIKLRKD